VALNELGEVRAADLLLTLDQEGDVAGIAATHCPQGVERCEAGNELALVVLGPRA